MHIGGATLIAQREGNVSPLMQENIKEEELGKEHDVNKEIKLSGERRKKMGWLYMMADKKANKGAQHSS